MKQIFQRAILLSLTLFLFSCGGSGGSGTAFFRFLAGTPNSSGFDLVLDGVVIAENVIFNQDTGYMDVSAGERLLEIQRSDSGATVLSIDTLFQAGTPYTIVTTGNLPATSPLFLVDIPVNDTPVGDSQLRFLHNAPSAPAIDLYFVEPGGSIAGRTPDISNLPSRALSSTVSIFASTARLVATVTGTATVLIDSGEQTFESGKEYTIVTQDAAGGGAPFQFAILEDRSA